MTADAIQYIKAVAKRLARERRIQHIAALELAAVAVGQPHWRGLTEAVKKGWSPTASQLEALNDLLDTSPLTGRREGDIAADGALDAFGDGLVFTRWVPSIGKPMEADEIYGELDGHPFYLVGDEFSVAIGSQGWEITLDQPPSAKPEIRRLGGRVKSAAALDPAFVERATQLLKIRARRMHAEVAADWPRRSTMPDQQGRVRHPLGKGLSAEWYCLHCDGAYNGADMAKNLWHCPDCGATPIDMFPEPFWNEARQPT